LAYVKQIGDQDIARGNPPLDVDSYLELLLSACSTFDKNHATSMKHKRNVYTPVVGGNNDIQSDDTSGNEQYYEAFTVDTDISEVLAYAHAGKRERQCCFKVSETRPRANCEVTEKVRLIVSDRAHPNKGRNKLKSGCRFVNKAMFTPYIPQTMSGCHKSSKSSTMSS
jgi:hypothetical protein